MIDRVVRVAQKARTKLLKQPGVVGVGHGWKESDGRRTTQYAITVYVREKRPLSQLKRQEQIPRKIDGVPTDVVVVGRRHERLADEHEHRFIDYVKMHREHVKALGKPVKLSVAHDRDIGNVAIVEDDSRQSFIIAPKKDVDWVGAYQKFRLTHPDIYDFVTFWSDFEVNCECGAFYCGLANPAKGINWEACMPNGRRGWGTRKLQAFMYFIREDDAALLQEVGHHWMAYAGFKNRASDRTASYDYCLGDQPGHWSSFFDDDRSPMDYDESELRLSSGVSVDWIDNGDGTFTARPVSQGEYAYCNLDLYLVGLIPPEEVGEFYFIKNPRRQGNKISGTSQVLTIQNVAWANGTRRPGVARSQKAFKQAFILLTKDASRAVTRAQQIDQIRQRYAEAFTRATGGRARVDTTLSQ